mgnify:CR=1 FL=1
MALATGAGASDPLSFGVGGQDFCELSSYCREYESADFSQPLLKVKMLPSCALLWMLLCLGVSLGGMCWALVLTYLLHR